MMDTPMHAHAPFGWLELVEAALFTVLAIFVAIMLIRLFLAAPGRAEAPARTMPAGTARSSGYRPEILLLMLGLPLHLLWEIAQFPLYTVWHDGNWSYILYGLVHCTLGDLLILLIVFWAVSLLKRSRYWIFSPAATDVALFTVLGLAYTVYSEIVNTRIEGTWGYTESMPIVPVIEIGCTPFMQWLLIPPVLVWLMNLASPRHPV